ncbi:hypothetical protein ME789_17730 [Lactobacillus delbrueckii]|jgi:hypothetical protein|nr:hypothetical protein ME789_17730 [Lactobacillus delbrueckii]
MTTFIVLFFLHKLSILLNSITVKLKVKTHILKGANELDAADSPNIIGPTMFCNCPPKFIALKSNVKY